MPIVRVEWVLSLQWNEGLGEIRTYVQDIYYTYCTCAVLWCFTKSGFLDSLYSVNLCVPFDSKWISGALFSGVGKATAVSRSLQHYPLSPSLSPSPMQRASLVETDLLYADALWDQEPSDTQELSFKANDVIEVLDMSDDDWWYGCVGCRSGWFPASFVRVSMTEDHVPQLTMCVHLSGHCILCLNDETHATLNQGFSKFCVVCACTRAGSPLLAGHYTSCQLYVECIFYSLCACASTPMSLYLPSPPLLPSIL